MEKRTMPFAQFAAQAVHAEQHMQKVLAAARKAGFTVVGDIIDMTSQEKK